MIYIVHPPSEIVSFLIEGIKKENIVLIHENKCWLTRIEQYINKHWFPFPAPFCNLLVYKKFKQIKPGDIVISWGQNELWDLKMIKKHVPSSAKLFIWQWNPYHVVYKSEIQQKIDAIKKLGYSITCFDKNDAKDFGLTCLGQIYRHTQLPAVACVYDFYFVGASKNRIDLINEIRQKTERFKCLFQVVSCQKDQVPYTTILQHIAQAKCIVDINQKGQEGLTLRPIEALFFKKKLLTTNKNIVNEPFYNPNNIFTIGIDSWDKLEDFLNADYCEIPQEIEQRYDINTWFEFFAKQ